VRLPQPLRPSNHSAVPASWAAGFPPHLSTPRSPPTLAAPPANTHSFLTRKQVCKLLGISETTFYIWRSKGKFPPPKVQVDSFIRWTREQIDEWLARGGAPDK
jgi:excisionase family DNA binding protein